MQARCGAAQRTACKRSNQGQPVDQAWLWRRSSFLPLGEWAGAPLFWPAAPHKRRRRQRQRWRAAAAWACMRLPTASRSVFALPAYACLPVRLAAAPRARLPTTAPRPALALTWARVVALSDRQCLTCPQQQHAQVRGRYTPRVTGALARRQCVVAPLTHSATVSELFCAVGWPSPAGPTAAAAAAAATAAAANPTVLSFCSTRKAA